MFVDLPLRLRMIARSVRMLVLSTLSLVMFCVEFTAAALVTVWVGIPLLALTIPWTRRLADRRRELSGTLLGRTITSPYLRVPEGSVIQRVRAAALDPAVRRDLYWLFVDGVAGLALACVSCVESLLDVLFWWLPPARVSMLHARTDAALLDVSEKSRLALRVEQLTESRTDTVQSQAAELRRIERDLHDGAQARIVGLGISLAMAEDLIDSDPAAARTLLAEARESSSAALTELRDLVRGIHPPVLADRGLVGAVQALALTMPLPVTVTATLRGRLPAPLESAGYFAIAEALTNVAKHSSAGGAFVDIAARDDETVQLTVRDDGVGGADGASGGGLRGIARRLSAFDGTLDVDSPAGGGTTLVMVLPCASSSPKTSPSSVTG